ncbi:hypothetical protein OROMI_012534 [Orobanche minor]
MQVAKVYCREVAEDTVDDNADDYINYKLGTVNMNATVKYDDAVKYEFKKFVMVPPNEATGFARPNEATGSSSASPETYMAISNAHKLFYKAYSLAKMILFPKDPTQNIRFLQRIQLDICGPIQTECHVFYGSS